VVEHAQDGRATTGIVHFLVVLDDTDGRSRSRETKQAQVRDAVLELIGRLTVGEAIPAERRLAVELGVSRPTLRAAIDELVRDGLLLRRHGKGTFVSEPKIALPLAMTSFSEDMARRGMRPGSRILSFDGITAGAKLGQRLRVSPGEPLWTIRRLRLADAETMAIELLHVPRRLLPGLRREQLEGTSFYELLAGHGIVVVSGIQTIEPTVTSDEESRILGVPVHSPAFLFERVSESADGEPVEFVRSLYRGDRYTLVTELTRPRR
jgi:GntR family transcriptional regulator